MCGRSSFPIICFGGTSYDVLLVLLRSATFQYVHVLLRSTASDYVLLHSTAAFYYVLLHSAAFYHPTAFFGVLLRSTAFYYVLDTLYCDVLLSSTTFDVLLRSTVFYYVLLQRCTNTFCYYYLLLCSTTQRHHCHVKKAAAQIAPICSRSVHKFHAFTEGVAFDAAEMFHGRWLLGQELKAAFTPNGRFMPDSDSHMCFYPIRADVIIGVQVTVKSGEMMSTPARKVDDDFWRQESLPWH